MVILDKGIAFRTLNLTSVFLLGMNESYCGSGETESKKSMYGVKVPKEFRLWLTVSEMLDYISQYWLPGLWKPTLCPGVCQDVSEGPQHFP